ncbi:MAG TPA: EthD family reductase [Candidatus Binataceae bacterium]|jgi:uncharacterized protein (TIGR02118 family)|nr:EthD family reductase [Candidatus Binataceae bacterium]
MIKAIYFLKRKAGMDLEDFRKYWLGRHAELVCKVPGVRSYAQCHTLESGYRKGEPLWDGIAELGYDDTDAMRRVATLPESRSATEDTANFADTARGGALLTVETVQKDGATNPSMVKMAGFAVRKAGMEAEAFQQYWRDVHGPLACKIPQVRRYVQCHPLLSAYRAGIKPIYDGVALTWFDNTADMREKPPEYKAIRRDEPNFLELHPENIIITREHIII